MKNKTLFLVLLINTLSLSGCGIEKVSADHTSNSSDEMSESIVSSYSNSSSEQIVSSDTINNSSSDSISSSQSSEISLPDVEIPDEKKHYRDQVNRESIVYSPKLENDPTHNIESLEIWQINDTHGALITEISDTGATLFNGLDKTANIIKQNTNDQYAAVKIANGDIFQGSAFSNILLGEPAISAFNEMDFDAFVIGNHEFDWGLDTLSIYKDNDLSNGELECDFLGANILDKNNKLPDWIKPYTIVNKGDLKVGIIGLIGDGQESSIAVSSLNGYHFTSTVEAVNKYSEILEDEENCDVIIVSVHDHDELKNSLYASDNKIDAIINAHDHYRVTESVMRYDDYVVPVIESNGSNANVGKITLKIDGNNNATSYAMRHFTTSSYRSDSATYDVLNVYYNVMKNYLNEVLTTKSQSYDKQGIGALGADCMLNAVENCDFAFTNQSGIRSSRINSGTVTVGNVYAAFPFDNCLAYATFTGAEIKEMFNSLNSQGIPSYSYYYFSSNGVVGVNGDFSDANIIDTNTYTIATFDFCATSYLDEYFNEQHNAVFTSVVVRDLVIDYFRNL